MMSDAALEEKKRHEEHRKQFDQVEELLKAQPDNPELLQLKKDLELVLNLGQELVASSSSSSAPSSSSNAAEVAQQIDWEINDRCIAPWDDGVPYVAKITEIDGSNVTVLFLEYGNAAIVQASDLATFQPAVRSNLVKGAQVKALFSEDGFFYDAAVVELDKHDADSVIVRFPKFGKKKYTVGVIDIIDVQKPVEDPLNVPEVATIPERLKFSAADSDATKLSKKRQVKRIKRDHKKRKLEVENTKKQNSWLTFQKKAKVSFGKKKSSIFQTTMEGRVGVMNSGKTPTEIQDRKRYVFDTTGVGSDDED